jgi:PLP dependent protein
MIAENVSALLNRIGQACNRSGRRAEEVRIVAAAKGKGREKIQAAIAAGISIIGHNYLQEAAREALPDCAADIEFHMIGHLQQNKSGKAVELFHAIETVDNEALAAALDRRAEKIGRKIGVMIQVNLALEPQKSGIPAQEVERLISVVRSLPALQLRGLMTMPPFFDDPEGARPYFAGLRQLRDNLIASGALTPEMKELSMGMTGDFEVAVEEGATMVRIGTALFGPRS